MYLTELEKKIIKDHYDRYIKDRDPSFEHILEMSVNYIILNGVINLTEDEEGIAEKELIDDSREYLNYLFNSEK